jgi:heterodisulfide reductase subunit C
MQEEVIKLGGKKKSRFMDNVMELLPEGGNLNLCLTCGACSSGCPATGLEGMDLRKFLRMAALGMDDELAMGILGENEREYLQDDLKAMAIYGA